MHRALSSSKPGQLYTTLDYLDFANQTSVYAECVNNTAATYWNT